jgi:hypothetical protein
LSFLKLWSQENEILISFQENEILLSELIPILENSYQLKFYYNEHTIRNKLVSVNFNQTPLSECLEKISIQTMLNFYLVNDQVFLFSGPEIKDNFGDEIQIGVIDKEESLTDKSLAELRRQEFEIVNIGYPGKTTNDLVILSGEVKSFDHKTPVVDGNVIVAGTNKGVSTNNRGGYNISLEKGNHTIQFSSIGMKPTQRMINIYSNGTLDVELETQIMVIGDVDIFGDQQETVAQVRSGIERMDEQTIKSLPALLGEPDVMKTTLMMPGVQTVGEGAAGFNVRGGKTDQNLILVDNAPLYYPSHFFGNFSAISSDMVKETILYKGSIPAKHGGRISSVYEINTKEGNHKQIKGAGGISPLSVKAMLEGPLLKNSGFIVSGRSTYSDYILDLIKIPDLYNSSVSFNDIQAKLNFNLTKKDQLNLGFYTSNDKYQLHSDTLYKYKNRIINLKYNHSFNEKWSTELAIFNSFFSYNISSQQEINQSFVMTHDVQNAGLKSFNEYKNYQGFILNFGADVNWYDVNPGNLSAPDGSKIIPFISTIENGMEYGAFTGAEFPVTPRWILEAGVRLSGYLSLANGTRYIYAPDKPITEDNIIDTVADNRYQIKKSYFNPEIRISSNFMLNNSSSVKIAYNRTSQYIHILTNSTAISPTDTWKLSDEFFKPQLGHQFSAGYFKSFNYSEYETSVEGFYKRIDNLKEYKPGASLVLNDHIETEIINGKGNSYGIEFSLKKNQGRLNGWLNYTYARTFIKSDSPYESEQINGGEYFPASYDKPHNLNLFANLKASRRIIFSSTLNYSTGRPITYPVAKYQLGEQVILHYSKFNQYRIPDYFRIDLSATIEGSLKANRKFDSSFTFSIYNVTARRNAYSVFFKSNGDSYEGYRLSVFATAIPTVTYNIRF